MVCIITMEGSECLDDGPLEDLITIFLNFGALKWYNHSSKITFRSCINSKQLKTCQWNLVVNIFNFKQKQIERWALFIDTKKRHQLVKCPAVGWGYQSLLCKWSDPTHQLVKYMFHITQPSNPERLLKIIYSCPSRLEDQKWNCWYKRSNQVSKILCCWGNGRVRIVHLPPVSYPQILVIHAKWASIQQRKPAIFWHQDMSSPNCNA